MSLNDDMFGSMLERMGIRGMGGKIYAHLITSLKPLTMKELAKRTGYSLSSISTNLNALVRFGFVTKAKKGGVYVYHAVKRTVQLYREQMKLLVDSELVPLQTRLADALRSEHNPRIKKELAMMLEEITELKGYLETQLKRHLPRRRGSVA
jgi:DNA-binding transcriptional regulator GbsR (MarR family)